VFLHLLHRDREAPLVKCWDGWRPLAAVCHRDTRHQQSSATKVLLNDAQPIVRVFKEHFIWPWLVLSESEFQFHTKEGYSNFINFDHTFFLEGQKQISLPASLSNTSGDGRRLKDSNEVPATGVARWLQVKIYNVF